MLEQFSSGVSKMSLEGKLGAINQLHQHIGTEKKLRKWQQTIAWFFFQTRRKEPDCCWLLRRSTNSLLKLRPWRFVVLLLLAFRMFGRRWRINLRGWTCPSWCHSGIDSRTKKRTSRSTKHAQDGFLSAVSRSENDFVLFHGAGLELYTDHRPPALLCFKSEQ